MDISRATEILRALGDGIDPLTGELLPDKCVCNQAEVVRAFACILRYLEQTRAKKPSPKNAGKPWSKEDDETLSQMFDRGCSRQELQTFFQRSGGAIAARLVRIGKIDSRDQFGMGI